jgi:hypothetical protein
MSKKPQTRQQRFRVEYAVAYDEVRQSAFQVGPTATIGTWGRSDGRKRARALARKMARQAMRSSL